MKSPTIGDTARTVARASVRTRVKWKEVIIFTLLAYSLAWAWSGYFLVPYLGDLLTRSTTPTDMVERLGPAATLGTMLTPMIAALIMRLLVSKEGLKGSLGLLRSPKYYLAALIVPAVFVTAVVRKRRRETVRLFARLISLPPSVRCSLCRCKRQVATAE